MTKDEALKMVRKAEETGNLQDLVDAVNACKEALENLEKQYTFSRNLSEKQHTFPDELEIANCDLKQPTQEPVAWLDEMQSITEQEYYQEPVAWQWLKSGHMRKKIPKTATPEHWRPLYTKEQL